MTARSQTVETCDCERKTFETQAKAAGRKVDTPEQHFFGVKPFDKETIVRYHCRFKASGLRAGFHKVSGVMGPDSFKLRLPASTLLVVEKAEKQQELYHEDSSPESPASESSCGFHRLPRIKFVQKMKKMAAD